LARVFISHSTKDQGVVDEMVRPLEEPGHDCYIATRNVHAGRHISKKVTREIDRSDALVVVLSVASNASPWVQQETGYAKGRLPIIPIKTDSSKPLALLEGVEALPLEEVPGELGTQIEQSIRGFAPSSPEGEETGDPDVCDPGPYDVGPGSYRRVTLSVQSGQRYEGSIEEQDNQAFYWAVVDEKNSWHSREERSGTGRTGKTTCRWERWVSELQ